MSFINSELSDITNPIRFFEYFFPKGFDKMYDDFFKFNANKYCLSDTSDDDFDEAPYHMIECDKNQDYIIIEEAAFANSNFISRSFRKTIQDILRQILDKELNESLYLTNEAFISKNSVEAKETLIQSLLSDMVYIIEYKLSLICKPKYSRQCQSILVDYIQKIEERYSNYVSNKKASYSKYLSTKITSSTTSLKMIESKYNRLNVLLEDLKEGGFLEPTLSLELFQRAFNGSNIESPLEIKWMKISYGKCYYTAVLELIQLLKQKEYIADYSYKQLSKIFVQSNGVPIPEGGWKGANHRKENRKKGKSPILNDISYIVNTF